MRLAFLSLFMGALVGMAYGLCNIRSPAPPIIALLGLLGMALGEQACITVKTRWPVSNAASVEKEVPTIPGR